jgi:hypothetical protein
MVSKFHENNRVLAVYDRGKVPSSKKSKQYLLDIKQNQDAPLFCMSHTISKDTATRTNVHKQAKHVTVRDHEKLCLEKLQNTFNSSPR